MKKSEPYWSSAANFGLTLGKQGKILLNNRKITVFGINCYNLISKCVHDAFNPQYAKHTLLTLKKYDVKLLRFNLGIYYDAELPLLIENQEKFLDLLREVFSFAETLNIGLIPSFFWHSYTVPNYFDEPFNAWGDTSSKTTQFLHDTVCSIAPVINRYRSLWGWEFGNEFNLQADLPNWQDFMGKEPLPNHSMRKARDDSDRITHESVRFAYRLFAGTVKRFDTHNRIIISGNADIRSSQWNQWKKFSFDHDSYKEHLEVVKHLHPSPINTVSEHIYFIHREKFFQRDNVSLYEYIRNSLYNSKKINKGYFIGEFGPPAEADNTPLRHYEKYRAMSEIFIKCGAQIALIWNFDDSMETEASFCENSEKGQYILQLLQEINTKSNKRRNMI